MARYSVRRTPFLWGNKNTYKEKAPPPPHKVAARMEVTSSDEHVTLARALTLYKAIFMSARHTKFFHTFQDISAIPGDNIWFGVNSPLPKIVQSVLEPFWHAFCLMVR